MRMNITSNKIVLFGPYIGDWKEEILSFRPLVKWIYDNIEFSNYYVSTHFNRQFLYDFIDDDKFIPVFESLTRDEKKQKGVVHKNIETKEYSSILLRKTKDYISDDTGKLKKEIIQYGLSYVKSIPNFSILNKSFSMIPYNTDKNKEKIIFIPDKSGNKKIVDIIMNHLIKNYSDDFVVIGDKKCTLQDENVIMKRSDYFETVYQQSIDYISNADLVITPCSHWTVLSNQQKTNVFSWGSGNISQYKTDEIYGFGNKNFIVDLNKYLKSEKIINYIDYVIEKIGG